MAENILNLQAKPAGYYSCRRNNMLEFIPRHCRKALEVGCSEGLFGRALKVERGSEVWGVEISKAPALSAMKRLDRVIIGDFENDVLPLPRKYFDCAIFNDVLEHFIDPWKALRRVSGYLTDDGFIVSSIPNVRYYHVLKDYLFNKNWDYGDEGVLDKTHLRFFTVNTIREMFQICGYRVVKIEGINGMDFPLPFRAINRIMMRKYEDTRFKQFACVAQKINVRDEDVKSVNRNYI